MMPGNANPMPHVLAHPKPFHIHQEASGLYVVLSRCVMKRGKLTYSSAEDAKRQYVRKGEHFGRFDTKAEAESHVGKIEKAVGG